ncbi:DUF5050 domain-containing protein [Paenibacillus mucilaginosus]|nr:DUF5050 domain-containing protein [Paenibacillus mucilaginosus]MCG7212735.1 DUF5050 domain-containing protein [Paenibacillus mucilaginosus]
MTKQKGVQRMLRKLNLWTAAAAAGLLMLGPITNAEAAATEAVEVAFPAFPVTVNETALDGVHSLYPLLLHKGVTYFPMTWNYTSALGLSVSWNAEDGLSLTKTEGICGPVPQTLSAELKNSGRAADAVPVPFPVTVNGKAVDSPNETYPLLLYRNITYFPMTWRFTKEEFGWQAAWDPVSGYSIQSCPVEAAAGKRLQTALNLSNGGQLAADEKWIYKNPVRNSEGPHSLVRTELNGEHPLKLSDDLAMYINASGEWLHYIAYDQSGTILKIRKDGTNRTILPATGVGELWADGEWLYYTKRTQQPESRENASSSPPGIYRMKTDGTGGVQLNPSGEVKSLYVYSDRIFYLKGEQGKEGLYSMKLDGSDDRKVQERVTDFIITEDWIYYVRDGKDLRKISLDGSIDIPLLEQEKPYMGRLSYKDGWIYFAAGATGIHGSLPLERVRLDGTGRETVFEARPTAIYWAGEAMYFAQWSLGSHVLYEHQLKEPAPKP